MRRLIKYQVKHEAAFTMIEMLISLAAIGVLFAILVVAAHQAFTVPAERSSLMNCKNNLMQALNVYYLNNYHQLHNTTQLVAIDNLVAQHYLDKDSLYDVGRFQYMVGVRVVNTHDRLELTIVTDDANSLVWMKPDKIDGNKATWYIVPQYGNTANSIRYNAVRLARENDDGKM
ncbi:MAG: type II secretion system protein [Gammaproteobacteria bacterium]